MPNRNIREEARGVRERESEIARELRIAREDFNQAEREYRLLSNEYKKMDDIHLKKVRHGEKESDQEASRRDITKRDLDNIRRTLDEKERVLMIAQSAEYNYRKKQYDMTKRIHRNPVSRFFSWVTSIPGRIVDRVCDAVLISSEAKRLNKLPEEQRQEEMRKVRASYALDQAERKMERPATTQAKEFILDHPEVGIKNFDHLKENQKDMITLEKMIGLACRTDQTLYLGIGRERLLKIELVDDEVIGNDGYVSVKLVLPGRNENGEAFLQEEKELAHIHVVQKGLEWEIDMASSTQVRLEAALSLGRHELTEVSQDKQPVSGLRKMDARESVIVASVTMDDAARKREAFTRAYDKESPVKDAQDGKKEKSSEKGNSGKGTPEAEKQPEKAQGKEEDKESPDQEADQEKKSEKPAERPREVTPQRKDTEKKVEAAIKELHKGYRKDKNLEDHKHPVTMTVDKYQVSICPPNAKHDTAYYQIDGRFAGNYLRSNANPRITMDYIRNHNVLDNPVKTIAHEKLNQLQLDGNVARGMLYDVNHHTADVPGHLNELAANGRSVNEKKVENFLKADIRQYGDKEAADTMSEIYRRIQSYDMDDAYRDSAAGRIYLNAYKDYMSREELSHAGQFKADQVDYVAKDGTLFDKDGKMFLSEDGKAVTLENCDQHCPPEEAKSIRETLTRMRQEEIGPAMDGMDKQPEKEEAPEEKADWLDSKEIETDRDVPVQEEEQDYMAWDDEQMNEDLRLQAEMDMDFDGGEDRV